MTATNAQASDVLKLRYWQHILNELLKKKTFKIPIHLGFGHEAVAIALNGVLEKSDVVSLTHRNAAYNLAISNSLDVVLDQYRLLPNSSGNGLMGSMNLAIENTQIAYTSSILGNDLPVAAGMAMNRKLVGRPGVSFVTTGDGAMEEGVFWETALFAHSHQLPLVIIIENNNYSMSSTIPQRRTEIRVDQVCAGLGLKYFNAQGSNLVATSHALAAARQAAASGKPACVELNVVTFNQHAGPTPGWPDDPLRIAIEDGFVVKESVEDPVYLLKQSMNQAEYEKLVAKIQRDCNCDQYLH